MNPERLATPISANQVLDAYYAHPTALMQTYEYFTQSGEFAKQAKHSFIQSALQGNTPDAPDFAYPKIDSPTLYQWRDELTAMLSDISEQDLDDETNRLIRENVSTRLAEIGIMLGTVRQQDTHANSTEYEMVSFQLRENMAEVYGRPEIDEFNRVLTARYDGLADVMARETGSNVIESCKRVIADSVAVPDVKGSIYSPQADTLTWYAARLRERIEPAVVAVQNALDAGEVSITENELDSAQIVAATKVALNAQRYLGWSAQLTDKTNVDTSQEDQSIYIPIKRSMKVTEFNQLMIGHEIDQHVGRRINGDATGVKILGGLGCTDYLQWEEGNGKANEALIKGSASLQTSAFGFFMTGGLIMGLDRGGDGRNFGETFDIVWRFNMLSDYAKGKLDGDISSEIIEEYMDSAYDHVRRLFRGTDGISRGTFYTKDAVNYYLGQLQVWQKWDKDMVELDEAARIVEHELERSAKINPLRPDHRRVAQTAISKSL